MMALGSGREQESGRAEWDGGTCCPHVLVYPERGCMPSWTGVHGVRLRLSGMLLVVRGRVAWASGAHLFAGVLRFMLVHVCMLMHATCCITAVWSVAKAGAREVRCGVCVGAWDLHLHL